MPWWEKQMLTISSLGIIGLISLLIYDLTFSWTQLCPLSLASESHTLAVVQLLQLSIFSHNSSKTQVKKWRKRSLRRKVIISNPFPFPLAISNRLLRNSMTFHLHPPPTWTSILSFWLPTESQAVRLPRKEACFSWVPGLVWVLHPSLSPIVP